jgi:hypothetical protein
VTGESISSATLGKQTVTTIRTIFSAVAAIFTAMFGFAMAGPLRGLSSSKATGLAALVAVFLESLFSPLFWILAVMFFVLFFAASRLANKPLRILLFWTPATAISMLGLCLFSLFAYVWIHFKRG